MAIQKGLPGFALTDHDSFEGIESVIKVFQRKKTGLFFIAGCEFSTFLEETGELHILGYFSDFSYKKMDGLTRQFKESRLGRAMRILDCLKKYNINLDINNIIKNNKAPVGRMHIAREMVRQGYAADTHEVFDKYLGGGRPCHIPRREVNTYDIIRTIKENNGNAVAAHPTFLYTSKNWNYLDKMISSGLSGIEYKHPKISHDLSRKIEETFSKSLILTAGSDFHGDDSKEEIGRFGLDLAQAEKYFRSFVPSFINN